MRPQDFHVVANSVIVPTVERVERTALRCSMAMAGDAFDAVHLWLVHRSKNCRA